jgi:hypothetical protein
VLRRKVRALEEAAARGPASAAPSAGGDVTRPVAAAAAAAGRAEEVGVLERRLAELEAAHARREADLRELLARAGSAAAAARRRHAAEVEAKNGMIRSFREEVRMRAPRARAHIAMHL